jgi:four helix bundle protein
MQIQSYRDLEAWKLAMEFVVRVYAVTKHFPREEFYGLTTQLRRATVAIPSNISEGHQQGTKNYLRYVTIAIGSLAEAETQLELARRLHFAAESELASIADFAVHVRRVLHGLRRSLVRRNSQPSPNP